MITADCITKTKLPADVNKTDVDSVHKLLIVVIENDKMVRLAMKLQLELHFQLEFFSTAEAGFAYILQHADVIDLIILDHRLPGMSGSELLVRIKRDPSLKHLPVILQSCTCKSMLDIETAEPDFYLRKPVERQHMMAAIASALGLTEAFWSGCK